MKASNLYLTILSAALFLFSSNASAQVVAKENLLGQRNVITTAVPFLTITPDARAAGMGDVGVATSPDAASIHWNPGKLSFIDNDGGISMSAAPWLRQLVPDVWLYYLSGYKKVGQNKRSAVAGSLRYFTLGNIQFTDNLGNPLGSDEPKEFALDAAYSTQLSKNLSVGVAIRFINSRLVSGTYNGVDIRPGFAGAGDIGIYWKDQGIKIGDRKWDYALGLAITNMGSKITYTSDAERDFIPINLRLGTHWETEIDEYNKIGLSVDFNKLLVPTPQPVYALDSNGKVITNSNGSPVIQTWQTPDKPVVAGMISSLGDAPAGFREELQEFTTSIGLEYWYADEFAFRMGYFRESPTKGGRNYITLGLGIKYNVFGLDVAYLKPFTQRHPLENTLRFSLSFDLAAFKSQGSTKDGQ